MIQATLDEVGFRWSRPRWERTADRSWVMIVPSRYLSGPDEDPTNEAYFDRTQRYYEVYNFDGSWVDQLHELQVERILRHPAWRAELAQTHRASFAP